MSGFAQAARWLWVETQLGAPPWAQRTVIPRLHKAKEIARLVKPWMPLYEMCGQNQAGALTVTYGGLGYFRGLLESMLFDQAPVETKRARALAWHPGRLDWTAASDLTVVESSQYLIHRLPNDHAIRLPFRIRFVVDLTGDWQQVEARFHHSIRRHMRRSAEEYCYDYSVTQSDQDLETFYYDMYLPTVRARHGKLAAILPFQEARQIMRHGWVFLVKRGGIGVAGTIGHVRENIVEFRELGVLNGDTQLMKEEIVDATNYVGMRWAHQQGYPAFGLGDTWPFMSGGFMAKRKWGSTVSVSPNQHKQIWIRFQRDTPAVRRFIQSHPCIIARPNGGLSPLHVVDDSSRISLPEITEWCKRYETPGLGEPLVCAAADLMPGGEGVGQLLKERARISQEGRS